MPAMLLCSHATSNAALQKENMTGSRVALGLSGAPNGRTNLSHTLAVQGSNGAMVSSECTESRSGWGV
jgi:hypothetical protein